MADDVDDIFDTVLSNIHKLDPTFKPGRITAQKRQTSVKLNYMELVPVGLLNGPYLLPVQYTTKGNPRRIQLAPQQTGDEVNARLEFNGEICLYPYESESFVDERKLIVNDAEENVHFEFI